MNSQYHKSLPDIHPDEIEYISSMLELPELDRLFWEIYYFLEFPHNSASIMELATQLIQVLEKCRLHYIKTYTYGEIKEDSSYTDILDYYINDYVFFPDIHFLLNAKNSVYYALTAYFTLNHSIYNLNKSSISEFEFLKQVIHILNTMNYANSSNLEELLEENHLDSIAKQRSEIGKNAADAKHKNTRLKKIEVYEHWVKEHQKNNISKNSFARKFASKYHQSPVTIRKWLQGEDPYMI